MTVIGHNSAALRDEMLVEALRSSSIRLAVEQWVKATGVQYVAIAADLGVSRQYLRDLLAQDRDLKDEHILALPDGLRQVVAEIRARQYEGSAANLRTLAGVPKKWVQS